MKVLEYGDHKNKRKQGGKLIPYINTEEVFGHIGDTFENTKGFR